MFDSIKEFLINFLSEAILDPLVGLINFIATGIVKFALTWSSNLYNAFIEMAMDILTLDPTALADGKAWNVVKTINNSFIAVGSSLIVLFFLISLCRDSLDVKDNVRMETIFKAFIKLSIAEFFVTQNLKVIQWIFQIGQGLSNIALGSSKNLKLTVDMDVIVTAIENGGAENIFVIMLAAIDFLVLGGCGLIIVYFAYERAIKILCVVPFGAIAYSTIGTGHQLSQTAVSYSKFLISVFFESATMLISLRICALLIGTSGGLLAGSSYTLFTDTIYGIIFSRMLSGILCVGLVKGSQTLVQRALAL